MHLLSTVNSYSQHSLTLAELSFSYPLTRGKGLSFFQRKPLPRHPAPRKADQVQFWDPVKTGDKSPQTPGNLFDRLPGVVYVMTADSGHSLISSLEGLIPPGTDGDDFDVSPDQFCHSGKIFTGSFRQLVNRGHSIQRGLPTGNHLVDGLHLFQIFHSGREFIGADTVDFVSGTDGDLIKFIQHVQFGDQQFVHTAQHAGVTGSHGIKPSAAAGAAGGGTELTAPGTEQFTVSIKGHPYILPKPISRWRVIATLHTLRLRFREVTLGTTVLL